MSEKDSSPKTIDEYIAAFPAEIQVELGAIRSAIREAIPHASEAIKYQMPTFVLDGNLVHFASFKEHIGFYGAPTKDPSVLRDAAPFSGPKGSLKFPHGKELPLSLIKRLVKVKAKQNATNKLALRKK